MSINRQNSLEGMIKEQATNFTNQAFDFLIQEVLRVDVWSGNFQNHLNRYGLDELLDELIEDELDVDYRQELEDLIMNFILEDYSHRIHIMITELKEGIDYSLESILYHKSNKFLTDNNMTDDPTALEEVNNILTTINKNILYDSQKVSKLEKLWEHIKERKLT